MKCFYESRGKLILLDINQKYKTLVLKNFHFGNDILCFTCVKRYISIIIIIIIISIKLSIPVNKELTFFMYMYIL